MKKMPYLLLLSVIIVLSLGFNSAFAHSSSLNDSLVTASVKEKN